ncbi:hypothetical protein Y032_0438g1477 [Ancylostoma ceylanicum]|uniref:Uncharacterized protein n=1 Tax=Ancylostoma ceylanicum TaxID=53326 RepID=A0A016X1J9_9BILA|nr:hypothetical protein Y032_0438g1477 [Ancylostoma ceylanicum]
MVVFVQESRTILNGSVAGPSLVIIFHGFLLEDTADSRHCKAKRGKRISRVAFLRVSTVAEKSLRGGGLPGQKSLLLFLSNPVSVSKLAWF